MIERRKELTRTELKRDPEQIRGWLNRPRAAITRTRLKRGPGRKATREKPDLDAFRAALVDRSGGWCEAYWIDAPGTGHPVCATRLRHAGVHPHHVWPEDRDRGVHDPGRGLWLCARSHDWAHSEPELAKLVGLLRPVAA